MTLVHAGCPWGLSFPYFAPGEKKLPSSCPSSPPFLWRSHPLAPFRVPIMFLDPGKGGKGIGPSWVRSTIDKGWSLWIPCTGVLDLWNIRFRDHAGVHRHRFGSACAEIPPNPACSGWCWTRRCERIRCTSLLLRHGPHPDRTSPRAARDASANAGKDAYGFPSALQARICTLHVRPFSLPRPGSGPPPSLGLTSSLNFRALVVLWSEHVLVHFRRSSHGARADLARLEDRSRTPWKVAGTKQTCVSHTWMNAHPRGTDR